MKDSTRPSTDSLENLTDAQRERAGHADEIYSRVCEESGIRISSWQSFKAWQKYVEGEINDSELTQNARSELEQFSKSFGKYVVIKKEEPRQSEEESEEKKRAKRANKIYRNACSETGISVCFFHDFSSWSDFVEGRIDESEFYERVKKEVREIAARSN